MTETSPEITEPHDLFPKMAFASGFTNPSPEVSVSDRSGDSVSQPLYSDHQSLEEYIRNLEGIIEHGVSTPAEKQHTISLLTNAKQKLSQL